MKLDLFKNGRLTQNQSRYFDMWRGGSALVVVIAHMCQIYRSSFHDVFVLISAALAGGAVMAFFALSGFFIQKSLSRCVVGNSVNWRSYFQSRADRIVPPFIISIALTVALWILAPYVFASGSHLFTLPNDRAEFSLDGLVYTLFFVNNFFGPALSANGPLWSLAYEVWYYIFACLFALAYVSDRRVIVIALPLFFLLVVLDVFFAILGLIWLGGFFVSMIHSNQPKLPNMLMRMPFGVVPALLLILIAFAPPRFTGKIALLFQLSFGVWMVFHMIRALARPVLPEWRPLVLSGTFSYSLYVLHFPIMLFLYGISTTLAFPSLFVVLAICMAIGKPIESLRLPWKAFGATKSP